MINSKRTQDRKTAQEAQRLIEMLDGEAERGFEE
jgi:hypothetical protein